MAARGLTSHKFTSRDFVKIFRSFDSDGNGYIDKNEIDEFLKVMFTEQHGKGGVITSTNMATKDKELNVRIAEEVARSSVGDMAPSKEEVEKFKVEVMSKYDENKDGKFTMQELQQILDVEENVLYKFNFNDGPITSVDFIKIWTHYDLDKSGYLEEDELEGFFYEFLQVHNKNVQPQQVKDFAKSFIELYDTNRDGKFELSELARVLEVEDNFIEQFRGKSELSKDDFARLFQHYDGDNSGEIEGDEITALLRDILLEQNRNQNITQADLEGIREQILEMFDTNKDGKLSKEEMSLLFSCKSPN